MSDTRDFLRSPAGEALRREFADKIAMQERATLFAAKGQTLESCRYHSGVLEGLQAGLNFLNEHE